MRIGPYRLQNNLVMAPMAGVTDRPFRELCRRHGAGLAVSEMISSNSALQATRKTQRRLDFSGEPAPVSVQILGSDPATMAEAARINVERGAHIIDINMGCPAKKVCKVNAGSALLRDESLVARILSAVTKAVEVPVTLKIRTGWDLANRNALSIARIAEHSGVQALTIHGRTRACGFSGEAEYETTRQVVEAVSIPVIANGDIDSPEKAKKVLASTGAEGIMIGRAAQGRPWIFRDIAHYLATGERLPPPSLDWVRVLLLQHLDDMLALYGEPHGVRIARKHIAWYSKGHPGGALFRKQVNRSETAKQQIELITMFFDSNRMSGKELAA